MPLVLYRSDKVTSIADVETIGVDWKNHTISDLDDWEEYMTYFGTKSNNYHPIEILAEYNSKFYSKLVKGNHDGAVESEGYKAYKRFFSF